MGLKIKQNKVGKSVGFMYYELIKDDATLFNRIMYKMIITVFILQYIMLIATAIAGFEMVGYFGPVSVTLGLGFTQVGLAVELLFTVFLTIIFVTMMKEKVKYNRYK